MGGHEAKGAKGWGANMMRNLVNCSTARAAWSLRLLLIFSFLLVPQLAFSHPALAAATPASDNFSRADGGLGPNWTAISDGAMAIASQQVIGTVGAVTGDIWTATTFASDQYSQIQVTSTPLSGGQWIAAAVRVQGGGQNAYAGLYYWNFGSPELMLFKRSGGAWAQLGSTYSSGALTAGTQLEVAAVGSTISFLQNGVQRISVADSSFTGGAPGIMAFGNATAGDWTGGNAVSYSVGGAVSGLSGTVVLQDNGGDNLSVTANGSFTFATALASGAAYSVTVKTNPSGQSCTVSNGSGTVAAANVTNVAVSCAANSGTSASDNFSRADGGLGPNWTAISDGAMAIASQQVIGTVGAVTGDIWTATTFASDQYSQIQVTSTPLSGGQWIAAAVRVQGGGQNAYAGLYYWNFGSPELMLFKRSGGAWAQLGSTYSSGALTAGTQLEVAAVGSTISFLQNGVQRISVTDSSFTGGAPGIMAYGNATAGNWTGGNAVSYSVGGAVSGLSGTVVLQDNGGDNLSVTANGSFTFATALASGAAYSVTVKTNPSGQSCTVSNGSGTVAAANVTNVAVSCATAASYSVGGTVSGLSGTVVLQDNGGDNLSVTANGSFTFATALAGGAAYSVTVKTNPSGQSCTVSNGSGTVAAANVTNVAVSCAANSGTSASDNFSRADGGLGPNWTAISDGAMAIASQQVIGTVGAVTGDIWTATTFASDQYSQIQVTSTPLSGGQWIAAAVRVQGGGQNAYAGLYYWNFGSPELMLFKRSGGAWAQLGSTYSSGALTAGTQLEVAAVGSTISFLQNGVQRISVTDSSFTGGAPGIMAYGNATAGDWTGGNAVSYSVGGTVSGLSGTVVLQDNGGDNLSVTANGSFTFATALASGAAYSVTVKTNPSGQSCTVSNGSGTVASANVTNVAVSCAANSGTSASDDFNRADGGLGPNWTAISDGAMAIASQQVIGTVGAVTGDIWTATTFASDQYSQMQVTSTPLTGGQWVAAGGAGPGRRAERLRGPVLLEFRQPGADAVQADRGRLDAARQHVQLRGAGGRDAAGGDRGRQHDLVLAERRPAHFGHRQQLHRRRAGHHGLRQRHRRQLVRRQRRELFGGRCCFGVVRDGGAAG